MFRRCLGSGRIETSTGGASGRSAALLSVIVFRFACLLAGLGVIAGPSLPSAVRAKLRRRFPVFFCPPFISFRCRLGAVIGRILAGLFESFREIFGDDKGGV